jgi:hypothetical protein
VPYISDENTPTSATENFFDRPHQASSDTLTASTNVNDEFAEVRAESQIMGAPEAENLRPVFPNESQPIRGTYSLSNSVFQPRRLPESWRPFA